MLLSISPASSGQQFLSGTVELLPCVTYPKQSDMFNNGVKHSLTAVGPGASGPRSPETGAGAATGAVAPDVFAGTVEKMVRVRNMAVIASFDIFLSLFSIQTRASVAMFLSCGGGFNFVKESSVFKLSMEIATLASRIQ